MNKPPATPDYEAWTEIAAVGLTKRVEPRHIVPIVGIIALGAGMWPSDVGLADRCVLGGMIVIITLVVFFFHAKTINISKHRTPDTGGQSGGEGQA